MKDIKTDTNPGKVPPQKDSSLDKFKKIFGEGAEFSGARTNDQVDGEGGDGGDTTDHSPRNDLLNSGDDSIRGRKSTESKFKLI